MHENNGNAWMVELGDAEGRPNGPRLAVSISLESTSEGRIL
jgi:hypothetical protein